MVVVALRLFSAQFPGLMLDIRLPFRSQFLSFFTHLTSTQTCLALANLEAREDAERRQVASRSHAPHERVCSSRSDVSADSCEREDMERESEEAPRSTCPQCWNTSQLRSSSSPVTPLATTSELVSPPVTF